MRFLESYKAQVTPEFPTGNGKLDLLIRHAGRLFGIEVKSFVNLVEYQAALVQTAHYARQLQLTEITLALFIDAVDEENRRKYEQLNLFGSPQISSLGKPHCPIVKTI